MKTSEIKEIFKDVEGSWQYDNRFIIDRGANIRHMKCKDGIGEYIQDKKSVVKRYRCKLCNKDTGDLYVNNMLISSLPTYVAQLVGETGKMSENQIPLAIDKNLDKTMTKPDIIMTKQTFDDNFFDKDDHKPNGDQKELDQNLKDAFNEEGSIVSDASLKRALRLVPRYQLFQMYLKRHELDDETYKKILLDSVIDRGLIDRVKRYELQLNTATRKGQQQIPATDTPDYEKKRIQILERQKLEAEQQIKTTPTQPQQVKPQMQVPFNLDFTKYITPENIGKNLAQMEFELINFIREIKKKKALSEDKYLQNCINSWIMFIGWLQVQYGMDIMKHIPLICFISNQMTLIAKAIKEP